MVGVSINSDDFCYSYYSNLYMKKLLSVISDDNRDDILKDRFDELYWKCPDIISHITLNFKYLYCINKKIFDEYYNNILSENGNLRNNYSELFIERENCIFNSKYLYMNDFINNKLDINDYSSDRIKKAYGYILNGTPNDDINEDVINLSYSLIEYKNYLRFKYIIDDIKNLYKEKDKYKGVYNSKKKEISKLEYENQNIEQENRSLIYRLSELFQLLKKFLRKLLQRGNDYTKDETADVVKDCYDNSEFDMGDVVRISKGTTKQDELFEYVEAPDYYKERVRDYDEGEYDKDDFDISR